MREERKVSSCQIKRSKAVFSPHSVREEISVRYQQNLPSLIWAEPQANWLGHGSGSHLDFLPLQQLHGALPQWPDELPLAEARLFWPGSAIHIVAENGGCRWAHIEETQEKPGDDVITVSRNSKPVYLLSRNELNRFGLLNKNWSESGLTETLTAITYYQQGRLLAWRLVTTNMENQDVRTKTIRGGNNKVRAKLWFHLSRWTRLFFPQKRDK